MSTIHLSLTTVLCPTRTRIQQKYYIIHRSFIIWLFSCPLSYYDVGTRWLCFRTYIIGVNPTFWSTRIKSDWFSDRPASSAFTRGCDELKRKPVTKDVSVPVVQPTPKLLLPRIDKGEVTSIDDRRQISEENDRRIEVMPEEGMERAERNYWTVWEWDWGLFRRAKDAREKQKREQAPSCVSWF